MFRAKFLVKKIIFDEPWVFFCRESFLMSSHSNSLVRNTKLHRKSKTQNHEILRDTALNFLSLLKLHHLRDNWRFSVDSPFPHKYKN